MRLPRQSEAPPVDRSSSTFHVSDATFTIFSAAVDRLEGAARVAHVLSNWAQDGTKLAAFNELAQQLPMEVLILKAVHDEFADAIQSAGAAHV